MGIEEDLKANIKEFLESAENDIVGKRYNSAINSYFKAIATLCDFSKNILKLII